MDLSEEFKSLWPYGSLSSNTLYSWVCAPETKFFFVSSSVLCLTLGRSSTIWLQASRTTTSPISCRPPTPPASPSINLKHPCPAWHTSPPPPTSPPTPQILTLHLTWLLDREETPLAWSPTRLEATPTSSPRAQGRSCYSRQAIMVSHRDDIWFIYFWNLKMHQCSIIHIEVRTWLQNTKKKKRKPKHEDP